MTKKERYEARKAAGLCVWCGKPAAEGQTRCLECKAKKAAYAKDMREWRKSIGICTVCGKNPAYRGSTCLVCKQDHNEAMREKKLTDEQKAKQREYNKAMRERRKSENRCVSCNRILPKGCKTVNCPACNAHKKRIQNEWAHNIGRKTPIVLRGNGDYCACCCKPVEKHGDKLCKRCYDLSVEKCAAMREKAPNDNYFSRLIKAQWKEYEARKEKYNEHN